MLRLSCTLPPAVFVYLRICIFVFVYLCMRHLVKPVLISLDQELSENIGFVWSKTSYSGDVTMRDERTNDKRTREDRATKPLDAGRLSFAKISKQQSWHCFLYDSKKQGQIIFLIIINDKQYFSLSTHAQ